MSYATKYRSSWDTPGGVRMTLDLQKDGYSGPVVPIKTIKGGVNIDAKPSDWYEPLIYQSISVNILNDRDEWYDFDDIMELEEREWKVVLDSSYGGTTRLFEGWINSDVVTSDYYNNSIITINGSHHLSKLSAATPEIINTGSRVPLIRVIGDSLRLTGKDSSIMINSSLEPSLGYPMGVGRTLFNRVALDTEVFWKNNIERDGGEEILREALKPFDTYLYWWDGSWRIQRYRDIGNVDRHWVVYPADSSSVGYADSFSTVVDPSTSYVLPITLNNLSETSGRFVNSSQSISMIPGLRELQIKKELKRYLNLTINDFSDISTYGEPQRPSDFEVLWEYVVIGGSVRFRWVIERDDVRYWHSTDYWISNSPVYGDIAFDYIYGSPTPAAKFTASLSADEISIPEKNSWTISHPSPDGAVGGTYTLTDVGAGSHSAFRRYKQAYSVSDTYPPFRGWRAYRNADAPNGYEYPGHQWSFSDPSAGYGLEESYGIMIRWYPGMTYKTISNALYRYSAPLYYEGGVLVSTDKHRQDLATRFRATVESELTTLEISWKYASPYPGAGGISRWDHRCWWYLQAVGVGYLHLYTPEDADPYWGIVPDREAGRNNEIVLRDSFDPGTAVAEIKVSVPVGDVSGYTFSGDQEFVFGITAEDIRRDDETEWRPDGQFPVIAYYGDVIISTSGPEQDNLLVAEMNKAVLERKRVSLDLFDITNLNYRNGLFTGVNWDRRTTSWRDDINQWLSLGTHLIRDRFQLYNRNRRVLSGTLKHIGPLEPFTVFEDNYAPGGKTYVLFGYSYDAGSDEYDVQLWEYDRDTEINLIES
jgi:hypothetical protein